MEAGRWLVAETNRPAWHWLETVLFTLLAGAVAYVASPRDPLLLEADFPWLLFPPVLLALRYGVLAGIASTGLLAVLWAFEREAGLVAAEPPVLHLAGALILALVCGEFAGLWNARLGRAERSLRYVREKLERLTREHYLLVRSHQRLEQEQLTRPMTLRSALARIRRLARAEAAPGELPGAQALVALLAPFCQLETAGLYDCRSGAPAAVPVASIGPVQPLDRADPLVRHCLQNRALAHVQTGEDAAATGQRYVMVAPVLSGDGELVGLLAVESMAFLALHEETLAMLAVLLGYYADALHAPRTARVIQRALPGCPIEFAEELVNVHRMAVESEVPSALVLLRCSGHADSAALATFVRHQVRDIDCIWELSPGAAAQGEFDMLILLPLANEDAALDAVERLERELETRYRLSFDAARIRAHTAQVGGRDPFVSLKLFLDLHEVHV